MRKQISDKMAKSEVDELTTKTIDNGGILVRMFFDMQSEKAEDLQPLMIDLANNRLLKMPGVVYCYGAIEEPLKMQDVFSTSAELTVLFKDLWSLLNVSFNFAPAGVELIKPERELKLKPADIETLAMNVSQISVDYSQYILGRVLKKEDLEKIHSITKNREELGKKLMEKKAAKPEDKK